jgi:hypothetical protein
MTINKIESTLSRCVSEGACTIWYGFYVSVSKDQVQDMIKLPASYENAMRGDLRTTAFVTARVQLAFKFDCREGQEEYKEKIVPSSMVKGCQREYRRLDFGLQHAPRKI